MARCTVPDRVQRSERMPDDVRITVRMAARTAQRTVATAGGTIIPLESGDRFRNPPGAEQYQRTAEDVAHPPWVNGQSTG